MKRIHSLTAIALTGLVGLSIVSAPIAASASEEGKRNTAIGIGLGLTAAALLLTQHNSHHSYGYNNYDSRYRRYDDDCYDSRDYRQNDHYRYNQDNSYSYRRNNNDNGYRTHEESSFRGNQGRSQRRGR